jgi:hypothetical protein
VNLIEVQVLLRKEVVFEISTLSDIFSLELLVELGIISDILGIRPIDAPIYFV